MKLTIIGAGAIGGTLGAFLTQGGHDVTVVDIVREHVNAINSHGIRISGVRGDHNYPLRALHLDDLGDELHNVILAVKGHFTHSVVSDTIAPRLSKDGYVVSLQNGLNEDTIATIIGRERTIGAFVHFGADYLEPGHIQLGQE
jgi:2-dehydropantoate 2-reductase